MKKECLTGKKIGRLTILDVIPKSEGSPEIYICSCDCGREMRVTRARMGQEQGKQCNTCRWGQIIYRNSVRPKLHVSPMHKIRTIDSKD